MNVRKKIFYNGLSFIALELAEVQMRSELEFWSRPISVVNSLILCCCGLFITK